MKSKWQVVEVNEGMMINTNTITSQMRSKASPHHGDQKNTKNIAENRRQAQENTAIRHTVPRSSFRSLSMISRTIWISTISDILWMVTKSNYTSVRCVTSHIKVSRTICIPWTSWGILAFSIASGVASLVIGFSLRSWCLTQSIARKCWSRCSRGRTRAWEQRDMSES